MLRLDELETLSRLAAGELPAGKAEQVKGELQRRPELAAAFEQLLSLDQALKELPPTLSSSELEALVARVPRPRRPFVRPPVAVTSGVAAAVLIAAIGTFLVTRNGQPQPRLVALMGTVTLDGRSLAPPSQALPLQPGAVVRCGVDSASIIESGQARMLLARDSELVVSGDATPDFALQSGTLAATGPEIRLSAGDAHFELTGRGVLSWEPEADLLRVTDGMDTKQPRRLGFKWLRLPIAATAVAAGGVTLLVLEGRAKVTTDSNARIEVTAGQKWSSSDARATPIPSGAALTASASKTATPRLRQERKTTIEPIPTSCALWPSAAKCGCIHQRLIAPWTRTIPESPATSGCHRTSRPRSATSTNAPLDGSTRALLLSTSEWEQTPTSQTHSRRWRSFKRYRGRRCPATGMPPF